MLQIEIHAPALEKEVNALIAAGLYADSQALMTDALEKLVTTKKRNLALMPQFYSINTTR